MNLLSVSQALDLYTFKTFLFLFLLLPRSFLALLHKCQLIFPFRVTAFLGRLPQSHSQGQVHSPTSLHVPQMSLSMLFVPLPNGVLRRHPSSLTAIAHDTELSGYWLPL